MTPASPPAEPPGDRRTSRAPRPRPSALRAGLPAAGLAALAAVAVGAALVGTPGGTGPGSSAGDRLSLQERARAGTAVRPVAFGTFPDCGRLDAYFRRYASMALRTDVAVGAVPPGAAAGGARDAAAEARAAAPASSAPTSAAPTSATGTNVQVEGVDEADVAKQVGDLVLTVASLGDVRGPEGSGRLSIVRVGDRDVARVGSLRLDGWTADQLLVHEGTALLFGTVPIPTPLRVPTTNPGDPRTDEGVARLPAPGSYGWWGSRVRIAEVDVRDPAAPRLVRTLDVDGTLLAARLVGGSARLAVSSTPTRTATSTPTRGTARRPARESDPGAWLPGYTLTGPDGRRSTGRLLDCAQVSAPTRFAGLDTLSLLSVDLTGPDGIGRWQRAGIVGSGTTLYATADRTYVATRPWPVAVPAASGPTRLRPPADSTELHVFATEGASAPRPLATGEVEGSLLGQFALDEHEGVLRVATTTAGSEPRAPLPLDPAVSGPAEGVGDAAAPSRAVPTESAVTVLERQGSRLVRVGRVGGLGRNETIHAVRFLGDVGYVVTFRRTDPLYALDLSDPRRPRVTGELKIPGFSAYLHPLDGGRLLGVGQDATADGRTTGVQVSLFDVSDPAAPRRIAQVAVPGQWSDVESDHHAFTYAGGTAVLPFTGVSSGLAAVPVTADGLGRPRVWRSDPVDAPVMRAFARGTGLVTVSASTVAVHDRETLARVAQVSLAE